MKGKKSDVEFISNFIIECANLGIVHPQEIVQQAKDKISDINKKIIEAERLKITRSKLIDVVFSLGKK